jgi:hypothetical protein
VVTLPQPAKSTVDVVVSIILMVLTLGLGVVGGATFFMMLAFTDHCPPETCSIEAAVTALLGSFVVAVFVGIAGAFVTIVRLVRRKAAWPWALGALIACGVIGFAGFAGYLAAVGG